MSASTSNETVLEGRVIGGQWRLERAIGSGATAVVFAARASDGRVAAVKLLTPDMAARPDVRRRFEREARVAEALAHPNVVTVFDQDTRDPEHAYIAMELLEGESLAERAKRCGKLPIPEILSYADQILDVLVLAHGRGVIHRDLKPGNVFVTREGRVKLLDFGLARLLDPDQHGAATQEGMALGTAPYMAPEQALGKIDQLDGRADLFSLGAILFRLISGRRIHEADTDAQILALMASRPAPAFASVCPEVPPGVAALIDLSLGFSREARYPDARTMQEDVRSLLGGAEPRHARTALASREQATMAPGTSAHGSAAGPTSAERASDPALALVGRTVAERYRVEELLGSGGMGAVYRAQHVHMRKSVALKVLHPEMTCLPEVVARFEREAVAAARIEHPNVATAKDFGQLEDGSFYLVLEYVEGSSLRHLLDRERVLGPSRAVAIARQIASALAAAHAAGIVHRDLKPDNVMLVARPEQAECVKVLDFGIAKLAPQETVDQQTVLTRLGSVFGTPAYMSPEQAMGQTVDSRADLYSLGILLYEMVSGRPPFADDEMIVVLTKQMTEPPPPLPASVDAALSKVIMGLLAKPPAERPSSADEVIAALDALVLSPTAAVGASERERAQLGVSETVLNLSLPRALSAPWSRFTLAVARWRGHPAVARLAARLVHPVRVGSRPMPLWWLLAAAASTTLLAVLTLTALSAALDRGGSGAPGAASASGAPPSGGLMAGVRRVLGSTSAEERERASKGDGAALSKIEQVPAERRSADEWRALTLGKAASGELGRAVALAREAFRSHPELGSDEALLALLHRAATTRDSSGAALALLEDTPGSAAADVIYLVADEGRRRDLPELAAQARKSLDSAEVRAKASPALRVALELEGTKKCEELKPIVERAARDADARSESRLKQLTNRRGCGGLFRRGDCFPCLRSSDALERALRRARENAAPSLATGAAPNMAP